MTLEQESEHDVVFVAELAYELQTTEKTIRKRMHLWERKPNDPLAIPYLKRLGKPYRTTRAVMRGLLSTTPATA